MCTNKINVGFVNRGISMFRGGGETFDINMAKSLKKIDVEVNFVSGKPVFMKIKYPIFEYKAEYCMSPYLRDLSQKIPFGYPLMELDLRLFSLSCSKLLSENPNFDIVQVLGLVDIVRYKQKIKKPIVAWFPGPPSVNQLKLIKQFDVVCADGDAFHKIKKNIREDVVSIPIGIDSNKFRFSSDELVRRKYSIPSDTKILLFVGRFIYLKNLPFLILSF